MSLLYSLSCTLIITLLGSPSFGEIKLPALISDGMVLQRDVELNIWGWASPGEQVSVKFRKKTYRTTADEKGNWSLKLPEQRSGGPFTMDVQGENHIVIKNILIGDVWLCSGQSNMVHYLALHSERYAKEIEEANFSEIRQFLVPTTPVLTGPANDFPETAWKAATSDNILRFSVVAYFFAKDLYERYKVPIGIINTSVGGSPIESWISEEGLRQFPEIISTVERNKDTAYVNRVNRIAEQKNSALFASQPKDQGLNGSVPWYDLNYQPQNWDRIAVPGYWEDQSVKDLDGVVWYRKEIDLPADMAGKQARVALGRIVDADYLYINGKQVGNTSYKYPQRRYNVPEGVLKEGKNVFVVRVINQQGRGGFVPDKPYYLAIGADTIDLKGYWQYKVGSVYHDTSTDEGGILLRNQPSVFYNGMIAPAVNYKVKGFVWYQGESNEERPLQYEALQRSLVSNWRAKWSQSELPFLYVQLPNYREVNYDPTESNWALLRQAQLNSLRIPNTGMAVTIDLGEWNDIHPDNKKPVGDRLALIARKLVYNEKDLVYSGPLYAASEVKGNKVILSFSHTGSGLMSKDREALRWFAIAGAGKNFVWAQAKIEDNKVVVWNEDVTDPAYIRYAWADNPDHVNFYNKEGLPASPFETDLPAAKQLWHGKKAAVVLTYDDALEVQLDNAIPALDSLGFKATFYLTADFPGSKNRLEDWKRAAQNGHELGNHTLYHPCDGSNPDRTWITLVNDLGIYTTAQIVREIEMTNVFLKSLDGKDERTFAYTCGETQTGQGSFIDAIKDQFVAMRGVHAKLNDPNDLNLSDLNCYLVDNSNADHLIEWAEQAREEHALLIILFHGVGGGHSSTIDLDKHNAFLKYLKDHEEDYWVTTLLEASKNCIEHKGE